MKIFLTGFMGSGKTSIGKMLAGELALSFKDLDEMIEKKTGKTISDIFNLWGESEFRKIEKEILHEIITISDDMVVATGGGTPCFFDNMEILIKNGMVTYLKLSSDLLCKRLSEDLNDRPLINGYADLKSFIEETLTKREYYYQQAPFVVEVKEMDTNEDVCDKIKKSLTKQTTGI